VARRRRHDDARAALLDPSGPRVRAHRGPAPREVRRVGARDRLVVDDPRLRHEERRDVRGVRLDLAELGGLDAADARQPVRVAAALELVQSGPLLFACGHDDLAAAIDRDAVLLAVALEGEAALRARRRLERAGLVVEARVDDAAVAARL